MTASSTAPPLAARSPGEQLAWRLLAALAWLALAAFAVQVAMRVTYPYELEWMEGSMVDHAERVRAGLGLYVAPSVQHVQFLYTPLLFQLGALVASVIGPGFLSLRLVSLAATLLCLWLLADWVRRETGERRAGLVAAGLFAAGYWFLQTWYDLARNDTLFLAGALGTAHLLRFGGRRAALLAAVTATLAFFAKQTALMWLPAIGVGALLLDWKKALWFGAATLIVLGGALLGCHLATDGWFTFFVFEMPSHHAIDGAYKTKFFWDDLVPLLPLIALALTTCALRWRAGERGQALFLAAFGGGGLCASWLSRLHVGGFDNVLMPCFAAGCLLAATALPALRSARARAIGAALLVAQFALLVVDPRSLWSAHDWLQGGGPRLPSAAHRQANDELVAYLRTVQGEVLVPFHGRLAALAGKASSAHGQAIFDLLQALPRLPDGRLDENALIDPAKRELLSPRARTALEAFYGSVLTTLSQRQVAAVVLDQQLGSIFEGLFALGLQGKWARRPEPLISAPPALQPPVGMITNSPYVLLPRD